MKKDFVFVFVSILCVTAFMPSLVYAQAENGKAKIEVERAVKHDVSQPLRDLPPQALERDGKAPREHPVKPIPHPEQKSATLVQPDGTLQATTIGPQVAATLSSGFDGLGIPNYSVNAAPPDTNGAVGATQYVQWVNEAYGVFDKVSGNLILGPRNGNTLWSGFGGPCEKFNDGDPIVQYDKAANRWVMTQFAVTQGTPYYQCVAVSTTSDATGTYNRYAFTYTDFNDYPKLAVWPDGYYITYNMFRGGTTFVGSRVCAFDRARMLNGLSATQQCVQLSSSFGGLLPSDLDGSIAPPAGSPNYLLNFGSNSLNLWRFHTDFITPANTTFTGPTNIPVAAFSTACGGGTCIPQPSTSQLLDSLADRLMYRLAYRRFADHESLVVNHSVSVGSTRRTRRSAVRWYELRSPGGAPTVYQQGTFSPDSNQRWMGSMAMDKIGNIGVGYSLSSGSVFPSIYFTGRNATDALGTLQTEFSIFGGGGSQLQTLSRWGDYSSLSVDPVDDCTMWYTTEYLKTSGTFNWSTHVGRIKFNNCR